MSWSVAKCMQILGAFIGNNFEIDECMKSWKRDQLVAKKISLFGTDVW